MVMNNPINEPIPFTSFLDKYQSTLRKKYLRIDGLYYDIIDHLKEQIKDFEFGDEFKRNPNFNLTDYTFLDDWESGLISSDEVFNIISKWDIVDVANLSTTRRLRNYKVLAAETRFVVDESLEKIRQVIIPEYIAYLNLMKRFFQKAVECDQQQVKVTWMEVTVTKEDSISKSTTELTLNQTVRQVDAYVKRHIQNAYYLGKNAIMIHEHKDDKGTARSHWLFAPESYINLMKKKYNIDDELDDSDDKNYLKDLLTGPNHVA